MAKTKTDVIRSRPMRWFRKTKGGRRATAKVHLIGGCQIRIESSPQDRPIVWQALRKARLDPKTYVNEHPGGSVTEPFATAELVLSEELQCSHLLRMTALDFIKEVLRTDGIHIVDGLVT